MRGLCRHSEFDDQDSRRHAGPAAAESGPAACRPLNPSKFIRLEQVTDAAELTFNMSESLPPTERSLWLTLVDEISDLVGKSALTSVIVTDDLPGVISELHTSIPWEYGARDDDSPYSRKKADGALAVGRIGQTSHQSYSWPMHRPAFRRHTIASLIRSYPTSSSDSVTPSATSPQPLVFR